LQREFRLKKITIQSGGTLASTTRIAGTVGVPGTITARRAGGGSAPSATFASPVDLAVASLNEEETGAGGVPVELFNWKWTNSPIRLNQNLGCLVRQDGTAGVGLLGVSMYWRLRTK